MKAMILDRIYDLNKEETPLKMVDLDILEPGDNEVMIRVKACGVCHTELDEIEGRTPPSVFPMVLGHQVVGTISETGNDVSKHQVGDRVGVAWIFSSCGKCNHCLSANDNLCNQFLATGRDRFGGYAEYMVVPEEYAFEIPKIFTDSQAAPLLCAGAIGYRSIKLSGLVNGQSIGLTGFGASGHLVLKMIKNKYPDSAVFVFARSEKEREFAIDLGAVWAGETFDTPPEKLDTIIDTTPVWKPVVEALKNLKTGGRLIINAIRKEDIDKEYLLNIDYTRDLWMEKEIKSVANVSRSDVQEFLDLAADIPIFPEIQEYTLEEANIALMELKQRKIRGAKVLVL